ncbi:MAG: metallophosphoesterase [Deltaproteobacteria bacterium]|jgi:predicted MPP superfamily phosphohydrolase|nr:metallophosphoesterase [Deltaproteobacteria bacterium]
MLFHPAISIAFLIAQIISWRLLTGRLAKGWPRKLLGFFYLIVNVTAISVLYNFYWTQEPPPANPVAWNYFYRPILLWEMVIFAWILSLAVLGIVSWPFKLIAKKKARGFPSLFKSKPRTPKFLNFNIFLLTLMLALTVYGYTEQLSAPQISRLELQFPRLPSELLGFKIVVLSDIHYGRGTNQSELISIFETVKSLKPDLVLLAGDLVDNNPDFAKDFRLPVARLEAPYGVYGVLGNHDLRVSSIDALITNLRLAGIHILLDSHQTISELPLDLIGFVDSGQKGFRATQTERRFNFTSLAGSLANPQNLTIMLNHRPEAVQEVQDYQVDLYLAGHTHGGHLAAPWDPQLNLASLVFGYRYTSGLYNIGGLKMYVSRGVSSFFPVRLWTPKEITLLTLIR